MVLAWLIRLDLRSNILVHLGLVVALCNLGIGYIIAYIALLVIVYSEDSKFGYLITNYFSSTIVFIKPSLKRLSL